PIRDGTTTRRYHWRRRVAPRRGPTRRSTSCGTTSARYVTRFVALAPVISLDPVAVVRGGTRRNAQVGGQVSDLSFEECSRVKVCQAGGSNCAGGVEFTLRADCSSSKLNYTSAGATRSSSPRSQRNRRALRGDANHVARVARLHVLFSGGHTGSCGAAAT